MDAIAAMFGFIVFASLLVLGFAFAYKNRRRIGKWLDYPYFAIEDRELRLKRTIEDAQKELEWLEKQKAETGD